MAADHNCYITHVGQDIPGIINDITHCNSDHCMTVFNTCLTFGLPFEIPHPAMAHKYTIH